MPQSNYSTIVQLAKDTDVKCPACGALVVDPEGCKPQPSCEHVRFVYLNGESFEYIQYIQPALHNELKKALAGANDDDANMRRWLERNSPEGTTIFEQPGGETACGHARFTFWFGFRTPPRPQN